MGFEKLVNEMDVKEAARLGMHSKPLTVANVQKHLEDLGIDPEFGTHSHIRGLSGGQKVKVVLAAAMWNNPHILVLDEPTNYLDRESLGALAAAIKDFGGGVVMISHHSGAPPALSFLLRVFRPRPVLAGSALTLASPLCFLPRGIWHLIALSALPFPWYLSELLPKIVVR
jgi:ABC-type nitrate/sulfonate/bicarbonate transport system ATPase subunit